MARHSLSPFRLRLAMKEMLLINKHVIGLPTEILLCIFEYLSMEDYVTVPTTTGTPKERERDREREKEKEKEKAKEKEKERRRRRRRTNSTFVACWDASYTIEVTELTTSRATYRVLGSLILVLSNVEPLPVVLSGTIVKQVLIL